MNDVKLTQDELQAIKDRADNAVPPSGIIVRNQLANVKELIRQDIPKLVAEVERLRKALEFYANAEEYEDSIVTTYGYTCPIAFDEGKTAREALECATTERCYYRK